MNHCIRIWAQIGGKQTKCTEKFMLRKMYDTNVEHSFLLCLLYHLGKTFFSALRKGRNHSWCGNGAMLIASQWELVGA